jgi:hypothetical protein
MCSYRRQHILIFQEGKLMEFINALDYSIPKRPYDYISYITINGTEVKTDNLVGISFSSYGKQTLTFKLCPGISKLVELLNQTSECDIVLYYASDDNDLTLAANCEYDHFTINSDTIELAFYTVHKDQVTLKEKTSQVDTYIKEPNDSPESN